MDEEDAITQGHTSRWQPPSYQLRVEELDCFVDMLNQLSRSLGRGFICVSNFRVSGFVKLINRIITDWSSKPQDLSVCLTLSVLLAKGTDGSPMIFLKALFPTDCDLQYYIDLSKSLTNLTGVLYLTLIENHYILLEHRYEDGQIIGHNSLKPYRDGHRDQYASHDVGDQCVLTAFLGKTWSREKVRDKKLDNIFNLHLFLSVSVQEDICHQSNRKADV